MALANAFFRTLPYIAVLRVKRDAAEIARIYPAALNWPLMGTNK